MPSAGQASSSCCTAAASSSACVASDAAMGFLKELFEKKLRSAGGKEFDDQGLDVGRSAHSEWALPQLRPHTTSLSGAAAGPPG